MAGKKDDKKDYSGVQFVVVPEYLAALTKGTVITGAEIEAMGYSPEAWLDEKIIVEHKLEKAKGQDAAPADAEVAQSPA